jgi:PAS domain S-box-containing protein
MREELYEISTAQEAAQRSEAARALSEERYQRLEENIPGVVYVMTLDRDGGAHFPYVGPGVRGMFALAPQDVMRDASLLFDLIHPADREPMEEAIAACARTLQPLRQEVRYFVAGEERWCDWISRPDKRSDGAITWDGIILDTTPRRRSEAALRESEERYRVLVEEMKDGLAVHDGNGRFTYVNGALCQMLGCPTHEMIGRTVSRFLTPESQSVLYHQTQLVEGREDSYELTWIAKDGHEIPTIVSPTAPHGTSLTGNVAVITDITDRKRAEREREALIRELEARNAELERFAYTVSHDLKSPLITITGFLGLLRKHLAGSNPDQMRRDITLVERAASRMSTLLDDLLDLARFGHGMASPQPVSMAELVEETVAGLAYLIEKSGARVEIQPNLPSIAGDRNRLREVFQNLLENAIKFIGDEPEPRVTVELRHDSGVPVWNVTDNGIGIPERYHSRVFELFEQLSPGGPGSGAGLAIVKRIVALHGGRIWIESEGAGRGTRFCFTLDALAAQ